MSVRQRGDQMIQSSKGKLLIETERAHKAARTRLTEQGYRYPVFDSSIPIDEYYEKLKAYGELEAQYTIEELKKKAGGERPIISYPSRNEFLSD